MMRLASMGRSATCTAAAWASVDAGQLVDTLLRSDEVEGAVVDGTAADHALDAFFLHGTELLDVGDAAQATGCEHRDRECLCELDRGLDVHAGQHAVATDVGVDHRLDAVVLELLRQIDDIVPGQFGPAVNRDLAVLGIEPNDDVAGKSAAGIVQKPGFFTAAVPMMT